MGLTVVTGANRGIGLELVRQLHDRGAAVVAICRNRSIELDRLGVRVESGYDLTAPGSWLSIGRIFERENIDLLIQNAGIASLASKDSVELDEVHAQFATNAVAPLILTRALAARLTRGGKVALISSRMGSIGDNGSGGYYGYRMSKAALNAAGVSLAHELRPAGVALVVLHPGAVRTDMTKHTGTIEVQEAARGLLARIDELRLETTGRFVHQNGEILPW
jgi:NAD(P)-dependent dehydrogenase (short-subunit alcohol dehydrogenase family)